MKDSNKITEIHNIEIIKIRLSTNMIEILSLPRRPKETNVDLSKYKLKSGLPLNSLPGWEHIPLNSKLPMLKCPDNHVIFTKNKIGQAIKNIRYVISINGCRPKNSKPIFKYRPTFDASATDGLPEYNPLQDSSLRAFYSNERNLKRLRENGEITKNNDVICNLKDFNEYRQQLHKSQLYYILQELNRRVSETHAEVSRNIPSLLHLSGDNTFLGLLVRLCSPSY